MQSIRETFGKKIVYFEEGIGGTKKTQKIKYIIKLVSILYEHNHENVVLYEYFVFGPKQL